MGQLALGSALVALAGIITLVTTRARARRAAPDSSAPRSVRRTAWIAVAIGVTGVLAATAVATIDTMRKRSRPVPTFASLLTTPDTSLRGTVAYLSEAKSATAGRQACARTVSASGAGQRDVYCWPLTAPANATVVWQPDGRLLVTSFRSASAPEWAKLVDVATGEVTDVPQDRLGEGAHASRGPATNAAGERLVREGADGTVHVALVGPTGAGRTVFSVDDGNPNWNIWSGPIWSPDFEWFVMWDGTRLLLTTVDDAVTRVLADEASVSADGERAPNVSIRADVAAS